MKNLSILTLSVLLLTGCASNRAVAQQNAPTISRSFPAASIRAVEANTSGGSITVTGDARSQATVEVFATNNNLSESRIRQILDENYDIDIRVQNGTLIASAKPKRNITNWNQNGVSISFKISVPANTSSDLKTSGGSIQLSHLNGGSQNFQTSGGSLSLESVSGNISGRTSGGSITMNNSSSNINLQTSGGSIVARNSNGNITLRTSGGSLQLDNLNGVIDASTSGGSVSANNVQGSLKARTSGGSVNINRMSGNLETSTSGGGMNVEMISVNQYVRVNNGSGAVNVTLPANRGYNLNVSASSRIESTQLLNFNGTFNERSINGTMGNGGTEVNVRGQRVNLVFR